MLRTITYIALFAFIIVQYGHNFIPEQYSVDFYFISLAVLTLLLSIVIRMLVSNLATNAILCLSIAKLFNEVVFQGESTYMEISCAMFLLILISFSKRKSLY